MEELISVVIPVYNTEKYLERCLNSVCKQEYSHLEIILVDDGSTDGSLGICYRFEKADSRIKVVQQDNQGPAQARNTGIKLAKGSYIAFVDSDDYVVPWFISRMHKLAKENQAQLVQCVIRKVSTYDELPVQTDVWYEIMSGVDFLRSYYNKRYSGFANPVNKLYDRVLFTELEFPAGRIHEDAALTYKIYYKAERVVYTNEEMYLYFMSENSIMRKPFYLQRLDWIPALEEKMDFLHKIGEESLYRRALQEYQAVLLKLYYNVKRYYSSEQDTLDMLKKKMCQNYKPMMAAREVAVTAKILYAVGRVFPYLIGMVINCLI